MDIIIIILIIVLAMLVVFAFTLKLNRKLAERKIQKQAANAVLKDRKNVKTSREGILALNKITKDFFREYLKLKGELTLKEISEVLRSKNDEESAAFCDKLDYLIYSGKEINKAESVQLIGEFIEITKRLGKQRRRH